MKTVFPRRGCPATCSIPVCLAEKFNIQGAGHLCPQSIRHIHGKLILFSTHSINYYLGLNQTGEYSMPNIATAIREEIVRLSRKELKKQTSVSKKASAQYRRDIASLKRQVKKLERTVAVLEKSVLAKPLKPEKNIDASNVRFSPKGLVAQRERLGLSASDYAKLAGVSGLSVYNWEKGKAKPRREQVVTLSALRGIGKREALLRLEKLGSKK